MKFNCNKLECIKFLTNSIGYIFVVINFLYVNMRRIQATDNLQLQQKKERRTKARSRTKDNGIANLNKINKHWQELREESIRQFRNASLQNNPEYIIGIDMFRTTPYQQNISHPVSNNLEKFINKGIANKKIDITWLEQYNASQEQKMKNQNQQQI